MNSEDKYNFVLSKVSSLSLSAKGVDEAVDTIMSAQDLRGLRREDVKNLVRHAILKHVYIKPERLKGQLDKVCFDIAMKLLGEQEQ